jgi:hypothetical protein
MGERDLLVHREITGAERDTELQELLAKSAQRTHGHDAREGVTIGELLAVMDAGRTPVIAIPSHDVRGIHARTTIDLRGEDVGQHVVVAYEDGDRSRPIVIGVLRSERTTAPAELLGNVDVSADGQRMIVSATRELVLRCGKASITLKQDGTVQIVGEKILSRAKGANRVQGGSVQLN